MSSLCVTEFPERPT